MTNDAPTPSATATPSVLMVEDDPDAAFLMKRALKRAGWQHAIVEASQGEEAVDLLVGKNGPPLRPAFIFLDLNMPRMNGFELLEWLGQRPDFAGIPAYVVSNSTHPGDLARAVELGALRCLEKPPQADLLRQILGLA